MTEQEKNEIIEEVEKRLEQKYKGCLSREDTQSVLKNVRVLRLARKALYIEENRKQPITIADRIRGMDDVELMNRIYELYALLSELGHYELAEQFCDCNAECADGEDCNEGRLKACILRWLQRSVEGC